MTAPEPDIEVAQTVIHYGDIMDDSIIHTMDAFCECGPELQVYDTEEDAEACDCGFVEPTHDHAEGCESRVLYPVINYRHRNQKQRDADDPS